MGASPTLVTKFFPGCSSVWSERTVWGGEVEGSNPSIPITYASVAQQELERETSNFMVAGSNPAGCTNFKEEQHEEAKAVFIRNTRRKRSTLG